MTQAHLPILDDLRVAAPCTAEWDQMAGDTRARFCGSCQKTVYDLSGLTTAEALALVNRPGETPCVRFFRRTDGTILTADCPVGLLARANRWRRRAVAASLALLAGVGGVVSALRPRANGVDQIPGPNLASPAPASAAIADDEALDLMRLPEMAEMTTISLDSPSPAPLDVTWIVEGGQSRIADDLIALRLRNLVQPRAYIDNTRAATIGVVSCRPEPPAAPAPPAPVKNALPPGA